MKKKINSKTCYLIVLFCMLPALSYGNTESVSSDFNTEEILFTNLKYSSDEFNKNLKIIDENLSEITFEFEMDGRTWTGGIAKAPYEDGINDKELKSEVDKFVGKINSLDYRRKENSNQPENASKMLNENKQQITMDDLLVKSVKLESIKKYDRQLNNVETSRAILTEGSNILNNITTNQNEISSANNQYTIDGSHYFMEQVGDAGELRYIKKWYNQVTGESKQVIATPTSPYAGDGNNRTDSKYNWHPSSVIFWGDQLGLDTKEPFTRITYDVSYEEKPYYLDNLQHDLNEAIEFEVLFYDHYKEDEGPNRGYSFVPKGVRRQWYSNIPEAYLDTTFEDNYGSVSSCVGCADANMLEPVDYVWAIDYEGIAKHPGYPQDGRFKVTVQRSYRTFIAGVSKAFGVFSEEFESILNLGLDKADDGEYLNWMRDSVYVHNQVGHPTLLQGAEFIFKDGRDTASNNAGNEVEPQ